MFDCRVCTAFYPQEPRKADAELGDGCGSPCSSCSPSRRAKLVQAAVKVNVYRSSGEMGKHQKEYMG